MKTCSSLNNVTQFKKMSTITFVLSLAFCFSVPTGFAEDNLPPKIYELGAYPDVGKVGAESIFYIYAVDPEGGIPQYSVTLAGDLDADGRITDTDAILVREAMNKPYDPEADVNADGVVNLWDLEYIHAHFGASFPAGFEEVGYASNTGTLNGARYAWVPTTDQAGKYDFVFKATDELRLKDIRILSYSIIQIENHSPYFVNLPDVIRGEVGTPVAFPVEIRDPDKEESITLRGMVEILNGTTAILATELVSGPNHIIDAAGNFMYTQVIYTAKWEQPMEGDHAGILSASDGLDPTVNSSTIQRILFHIIPLPVNQLPVIRAPQTMEGKVGELMQFTVAAEDPDGYVSKLYAMNLPEGAKFETASITTATAHYGIFSWTPSGAVDGHQVTFCAVDNVNAESCTQTLLTVQPAPPVNHPPEMLYVNNDRNRVLYWKGTDAEDGENIRYQYRVDNGIWGAATQATSIRVADLVGVNNNLRHLFEVRAVDSQGALSEPKSVVFYYKGHRG